MSKHRYAPKRRKKPVRYGYLRGVVFGVRKHDGAHWPQAPGTLVFFGGAVHEVLDDGHSTRVRNDLVPGSPKHLWKPKFAKTAGAKPRVTRKSRSRGTSRAKGVSTRRRTVRRPKRWIQKLHLKKGLLHREMGIPVGQKIPLAVLHEEHLVRTAALERARRSGASAATIHRLRSRVGRTQFALRARGFGRVRKRRSR